LSYENKHYHNIAFLATKNEINAYKNKHITFESKLSPTPSLNQNKARKPTNTSRAILDLYLKIYDSKQA
jgi:hypothetical protein